MKSPLQSLDHESGLSLEWPQGESKVPLLSSRSEKRANQREIISSERDSLVEDYCGNSPEIGRLSISKLLIINKLTRWRWLESAANCSPGQFPVNREIYRENREFGQKIRHLSRTIALNQGRFWSPDPIELMNRTGNSHIGSGNWI